MNKSVLRVLEFFTVVLCLVVLFPLVLMIVNAAKSSFQITNDPLSLPDNWFNIIENIKFILSDQNIRYIPSFISSSVITVFSLFFITISASMAAWVLVRTKKKIATVLFLIFVGAMVIPFQVVMLPLISWLRIFGSFIGIKMLRSYVGIIFTYIGFGTPLSIFLFHGFIKGIPLELEDAACVDGCNPFQTFFYIILPILKPVYMTVLILNGIWIWNDFLLPILMLGKGNQIQTIPLAVANFVGSYVKQWELILTASFLSIIPVVILFVFVQKYIIKGMIGGAIK